MSTLNRPLIFPILPLSCFDLAPTIGRLIASSQAPPRWRNHLRNVTALLWLLAFSCNTFALNNVVFSNANQPTKLPPFNVEVSLPAQPATAIPFTTNATDTEFKGVRIAVYMASVASTFLVRLHEVDNSGAVPVPSATQFNNLNGPGNSTEGLNGVVDFSFPAPLSLLPNTGYFLVIEDGTNNAVTDLTTRIGTGTDLTPAKYTLGLPGVSPVSTCKRRRGTWSCAAGLLTSNVFPLIDIVASPPAPPNYSLTSSTQLLDFGSVAIGNESAPASVTITNDGGAAQTLGTLSTTSGYLIKTDNCSGVILAINASCTVSVAFKPVSGGPTIGALRIPSDPMDPAQQYSVALSGSAPLSFTVGGQLSDLATGQSIGLLLNGSQPLTLTADGAFTFPAQNDGTGYLVNVSSQPTGQTCSVNNGSGTLAGADITNVDVQCVDNYYRLGGLVSGLAAGDNLTLVNNNGDDLTVTANGVFTFPTRVAYQDSFNVTVKTQPAAPSENCSVANGSGTMGAADINTVAVNCVLNTFTVGGSLTGLPSGDSIELLLNGAKSQTLSNNGTFVFPALADGTPYSVTVGRQPTGYNCTAANGAGTLAGANISNVAVSCTANEYTVGGYLSGLASGKTIVLTNNGGDDLSLTADGGFAFATPVAFGAGYSVAIKTQPVGETCSVNNAAGTVPDAPVSQVSVTCTVDTYRVTGNANGLATGEQLELLLNNATSITLTGNGFFQFPPLADGSTYDVTVGAQPTGQTCSVNNGSGTLAGADVSNVEANCIDKTAVVSVSGTGPSGVTASLSIVGCSAIASATFITAPDSPSKPTGVDFPFGLIDFEATACSTLNNGIEITLDYSQAVDTAAVLYKEEGAANAYFPYSATFSGSTITYRLTDNGAGDEDSAIGTIHDPAGPAVPVPPVVATPPTPVPALPLFLLLGTLLGMVWVAFNGLGHPQARRWT